MNCRILIILSLFAMMSCKVFKKDKTEESDNYCGKTPELIVDKSDNIPEGASVTIDNASISGNILALEVSYSGGCTEHEFRLYFNGNYKKSLPPKATLVLYHDSKDDVCRSIVTKSLKFDISKAQYPGQNKLIINLPGYDQELTYNY